MKYGKYDARRKRRAARKNHRGIFICLFVLALLVAGIILLSRSCSQGNDVPDTQPGDPSAATQDTSTEPASDPTAAPITDPATEPITEPATEPATQPATEPTTEPATEPTEAPATEPAPPATEPIVQSPTEPTTLGQDVAAVARSVIGKPYAYGGADTNGFDTSGLISYCFRQCDISVPRTVSTQFEHGTPIALEDLQPGDVVFFSLETSGEAEYVGIYIGNSTFIAVSSAKNAVGEKYMGSGYFAERFVGARRYW